VTRVKKFIKLKVVSGIGYRVAGVPLRPVALAPKKKRGEPLWFPQIIYEDVKFYNTPISSIALATFRKPAILAPFT
jgi:hypothetical protein